MVLKPQPVSLDQSSYTCIDLLGIVGISQDSINYNPGTRGSGYIQATHLLREQLWTSAIMGLDT